MGERFGIILIDGNEVIIKIYELDKTNRWRLIRYRDHDLIPYTPTEKITSQEIIEIIAETSFSSYAVHVNNWRILSRNNNEETIQAVSHATAIQAEVISLSREQELLCKGLLTEFT